MDRPGTARRLESRLASVKRLSKFMFFRNQVVPYEQATVHVETLAVKYSHLVYDAVRLEWNAEQEKLYAFRLHDHLARLLRAMKVADIPGPDDIDWYVRTLTELVRANEFREDGYVRIQVMIADDVQSMVEKGSVTVAMNTIAQGQELHPGVHVQVSPWSRVSDPTMPPRVKSAANYLSTRIVLAQARAYGYDDAIQLTADGKLSEGAQACVLAIRGRKLIAPPSSDSGVRGPAREEINTETIIRLAKDKFGLEFEERSIDRAELYGFDEVFYSTNLHIWPILSIDRRPVGDGRLGVLTKQLYDLTTAYARGTQGDPYGWLTPV